MTSAKHLLTLTRDHPVLCLGLDPHPAVLDVFGCPDTPEGLHSWVQILLGQVLEVGVPMVKPQVALFERHGVAGMAALALLMGELRTRGVFVIGDAKRGDIGSTMSAYASAWLSQGGDFEVDALTVSPYLGVGSLEPALELARAEGKAVFVLAATSNTEALGLQSARVADGSTIAAMVMAEVAAWSDRSGSPAGIGVVVGATLDHATLGIDLSHYPDMPILAPGYGAQGAKLTDVRAHFPHSRHVVAVVARSVLDGGGAAFPSRYSEALGELGRT